MPTLMVTAFPMKQVQTGAVNGDVLA